jgi:sugar lactone lactonase YvrE
MNAARTVTATFTTAQAGGGAGIITTVAGTGTAGFSGDGGAATSAMLTYPFEVAIDSSGNLYIADSDNQRIRKVSAATGIITTVAGSGAQGYSGDGGAATSAMLNWPYGVAVDSSGNLYIADWGNQRIRKVNAATGIITTVAGAGSTGVYGFGGDGGAATSAAIGLPIRVTLDPSGNLYFTSYSIQTIRKVNGATGIITTVAGNGTSGFSGDGGAATNAMLNGPNGVAVDPLGNLYISDGANSRIRKVDGAAGIITTVAGSGAQGYSGDGGAATSAMLNAQIGVAVDPLGNLYIADSGNQRIRKVTFDNTNTSKLTPTITWTTPAAIIYGTALSATQLNATASVAGTYSYTPAAGTLLNAGQQTLTVNFTPTDTTNYNTATASVTLTVNKATPIITWTTPVAISVGTALTATQLNATASVPGTFIYNPALGTVMSSIGPFPLSANFTPTDTMNYNTTSAWVILGVNAVTKTTPTITWVAPAAITYGTSLTTAQLNASSATAGSFVYTPALGTVLPAGVQILSVTLTPTDTTNYNAATQTVQLTVNKAALSVTGSNQSMIYGGTLPTLTGTLTGVIPGDGITASYATTGSSSAAVGSYPITATLSDPNSKLTNYSVTNTPGTLTIGKASPTITWANPAAITYGTALSGTQLNASTALAGSFAYTPSSGTVLGGGTQMLSATFTPTDTANYTTVTRTVQLTVNKATPAITWTTPAPVVYGTALSATQLNATASVPGTFAYSPAAGTVPAVGGNTLSVMFTPTDMTDYTTATATVSLVVSSPLNPVPVIGSMSPAFTSAGSAAFTLTVYGSGFTADSTVYWGTTALTTQYGNATHLTAQVSAATIASTGLTAITVQTPAPGGGASNSLQFEVDSAGATPPSFSTLTATVTHGTTATYPVTLPSSATNVSVTCLNLPSGANCSYSASTSLLTITTSSTTPAGTYQITVVFTETLPGAAAFILLPILLLPLVIARKNGVRGRNLFITFVGSILLVITAASVGCGGAAGGSGATFKTHQVTSSAVVSLIVQ